MQWSSISELVKDLNLTIESTDEDSVKAEIRKQLSIIHPDKNNGNFKSESERERYYKLNQAIEFLEDADKQGQALTTIHRSSAIVKASIDELAFMEEERLSRKQEECRSAHKSALKSKYFFPRLKSGLFAGFCGLLLTFAEQLKTHPFFQQFLTLGYKKIGNFNELLERQARLLQSERGISSDNSAMLNEAYKAALNAYADGRLSWLYPILFVLFIFSGVLFLLTWKSHILPSGKVVSVLVAVTMAFLPSSRPNTKVPVLRALSAICDSLSAFIMLRAKR